MYVGGAALKSECVYCIYAAIVLQAFVVLDGNWAGAEVGIGFRAGTGVVPDPKLSLPALRK